MTDLFGREALENLSQYEGTLQMSDSGMQRPSLRNITPLGPLNWLGEQQARDPKFARSIGKAAVREGVRVAGSASLLIGAVPTAIDYFSGGGTELQDKYFASHDRTFGAAEDYWTSSPEETSMAAEVAGKLAVDIPLMIANPAAAGGLLGVGEAADLMKEGVPVDQALKVGGVEALSMVLGYYVPMAGRTAVQRLLVGGIGFNVAQGVGTRALQQAIIEDPKVREMYGALDPTQVTLDVLLGLAFGAYAEMSPEARAHGTQAWEDMKQWARFWSPEQKDAIAVLRQAYHMNEESMRGQPATPADRDRHVDRMKATISALESNTPINEVELPPEPQVEPAPEKDAARESLRVRAVQDAHAALREEDRQPEIDPSRPLDLSQIEMLLPNEQPAAIAKSIEERLVESGMPADEAQTNAAIWKAWIQSTAETHGLSPTEVLRDYGLDIRQGTDAEQPPGDNVLYQARDAEWYYSQLEREVDTANMKQAPAEAWKQYLKSRVGHGLKPDEIDFTGVNEWLDMQEGRVTKEQVQEFLKNNGVRVEDYVYGGEGAGRSILDVTVRADVDALADTPEQWTFRSTAADNRTEWEAVDREGTVVRSGEDVNEYWRAKQADNAPTTFEDLQQVYRVLSYLNHGVAYADPWPPRDIQNALDIARGAGFDLDSNNPDEPADPERIYGYMLPNDELVTDGADVLDYYRNRDASDPAIERRVAEAMADVLDYYNAIDTDVPRTLAPHTRYGDYVLPGGKNYRELLLMLPPKQPPTDLPPGYKIEESDQRQAAAEAQTVLERMTANYRAWLARQGLPQYSADELLADTRIDLSSDQRNYLSNFQMRWEAVSKIISGNSTAYDLVTPTGQRFALGNRTGPDAIPEATRDAVGIHKEQNHPYYHVPKKYQGGHYAQDNVLAHVRLDERTGPKGERILFIEEFQSDWSKEGKKGGFTQPPKAIPGMPEQLADLGYMIDYQPGMDTPWVVVDSQGTARGRFVDAGRADRFVTAQWMAANTSERGEVPVAPFVSTRRWGVMVKGEDGNERLVMAKDKNGKTGSQPESWGTEDQAAKAAEKLGGRVYDMGYKADTESWTRLAMKRMLRWAAENGFDAVAWTSGEQQVDRYQSALRKRVDQIEWEKTDQGIQIRGYKFTGEIQREVATPRRVTQLENELNLAENEMAAARTEMVHTPGLVRRILGEHNAITPDMPEDVAGPVLANIGLMATDLRDMYGDNYVVHYYDRAGAYLVEVLNPDGQPEYYEIPLPGQGEITRPTLQQAEEALVSEFVVFERPDLLPEDNSVVSRYAALHEIVVATAGELGRAKRSQINQGRHRSIVVDTTQSENALSDAIGKAMAQQIIESPERTGTIEGDNIRIDDTGMAGYYDRMLPRITQNLIKKMGGKVGVLEFDLQTPENIDYEAMRIDPEEMQPWRDNAGNQIDVREMSAADFDINVGAEDFADGHPPWIAEAPIRLRGHTYDAELIGDRNGIQLTVMTGEDPLIFARQWEVDGMDPVAVRDVMQEMIGTAGEKTWSELQYTNGDLGDNAPLNDLLLSKQLGFEMTPEMRKQALQKQPLFQDHRGRVTFGEGRTLLELLEQANRSTFMHETAHVFLQITRDLATRIDAPDRALEDWAKIADWLGMQGKEPGAITRDQHEKFASGFETYLAEGKAPSEELRNVFKRFRDWLIEIYRSVTGMRVQLNDDIRGVFDRMLTSREQETSAPPEQPGRPTPPPGAPPGTPAAAEAQRLSIDHPEVQNFIRGVEPELGWAQEGGKWQGEKAPGEPNFTAWVPKSDWWPRKPKGMTEKKAREALRRYWAGEPLRKPERAFMDLLVDVANERIQATREAVSQIPDTDMIREELDLADIEVNQQAIDDADLVARASAKDEAAFERAAIQYEDNYDGFIEELKRITGDQPADAQGPQRAEDNRGRPAREEPAGAPAEEADPTYIAARHFVDEHPEQLITIGRDQDGQPVKIKASEYLADAEDAVELARQDKELFKIAATCLFSGGNQ